MTRILEFAPIVSSQRSIDRSAQNFSVRNIGQGLFNFSIGIVGFGLDFCSLVWSSVIIIACNNRPKHLLKAIEEKKHIQKFAKFVCAYITVKGIVSTFGNLIYEQGLLLFFHISKTYLTHF